jgi:hypothetical protein
MVDPGQVLTRCTIDLALLFYGLAVVLMLRLDVRGWRAATPTGRVARLCWSLGCLVYLVHVALAFEHYHGWSHEAALRHVESISGFGPGLFVSYLFTLAWVGDVVCWWLRPARYAGRPTWIGCSLHAFLAFVVFNGSVVYATGPIRWAGAALFAVLALCLWRRRPLVCGGTP